LSNTIHASASVSATAELGNNNVIGPLVCIDDGVQLGNGNTVMQGVVLKPGTRLGDNNTLHEYTVIGGIPQDLSFDGRPSGVSIGNDNTFREYVSINRATRVGGATLVGDSNYLMTQVHLGHDCCLAEQVIIAPGACLGGHVQVAGRAFISGGVMVHQFVEVGTLAMVGGNAKITQNVLPYMITDGVPASVHGLNLVGLKRAGFKLEELRTLKWAYKTIHRSGQSLEIILRQLRAQPGVHSQHLADFIANAKRGFHREK